MGKRVKKSKPADVALGPLPWLVDFANFGLDRTQPNGPSERLGKSRFLAADPDSSRQETELGAVTSPSGRPIADVVTQQHRGGILKWVRYSGQMFPLGAGRPLLSEIVGTDAWRDELPPPRAIMPVPSTGVTWHAALATAAEYPDDPDAGLEEFWRKLCQVQIVASIALEEARYLVHPGDTAEQWHRGMLTLIVTAIASLGDPSPPWYEMGTPSDNAGSGVMIELTRLVVENPGPVWLVGAPYQQPAAFTPAYVSDSLPGIVWAELLNFLVLEAADASALRCCAWCGGFWIVARRPPGRPREFCSRACATRFHDYGPAERRSHRAQ